MKKEFCLFICVVLALMLCTQSFGGTGVYEAEDAVLGGGAHVDNDQAGYTGTGYVDYANPSGDYVEWTVNMASGGNYDIAFRYALASGDRPLEIQVNGQVVEPSLSFPATGSFTIWGMTASLYVTLNAGDNTVRATAIGSSGGNVDHLNVLPPDTDPPTPNPATFASAPAAVSDTGITMTATTGTDATGPVEYYFAETSGNPGGTDSGWQTWTSYTDRGLTASTQYTYTVQMRDSAPTPNVGTASAPANATTGTGQSGPGVYEAEDAVLGGGAHVDNDQAGYTGTGYVDYANPSGDYVEWTVNMASGGNYDIDFRYALASGDRPLEIQVNGQVVEPSLSFPATGSFTIWGMTASLDVTLNAGDNTVRATAIGSSGGNVDHLNVQPPDTDPPTPNPATFASAPAAVSDTGITMTATTGTDATGPVEYYFAETSGNPGGTDSGWQTWTSYTDGGLTASTQYTYTVTMRDSLGNTGSASAPANATTDTDPPPSQVPAEAWNNVGDYVQVWWADGLRRLTRIFNVQTSRYGLSFDYDDLAINTFGPIADPGTEDQVVVQDNTVVNSLPAAAIDLVIEENSNRYTGTGVSNSDTGNCQLVEHGKYFHRKWIKGLTFDSGVPSGSANLMVSAWPDRINFALYFTPDLAMINGALEVTIDIDSIYSTLLSDGASRALATSSNGAGYIFLKDDSSATLTCDSTNTKCTVRLDPEQWSGGVEKSVGITVYPVAGDSTNELADVEISESTGISVTATQTAPSTASLTDSYDPRCGWYKIDMRNDIPQHNNDAIERVDLTLENTNASDVEVRLNFDAAPMNNIMGVSLVLCDDLYNPTGIPIQLSKNWHYGTSSARFEGLWHKGFTMLTVPANTTVNLKYQRVNGHWGGVAAASHAQLCLIGWGQNQLWDQAGLGAWSETITYDPDMANGESMIDDVRPVMVYTMDTSSPIEWGWTNNVGGADFLCYWDINGTRLFNSNIKTKYTSQCPNLTDVSYSGECANGAIQLQCTTKMYRTDDIVRGVYKLRYDITTPLDVDASPDGNKKRIAFFQLGADRYNFHDFEKMARGNSAGLIEEWAPVKGGETYSRVAIPCTGTTPWFSLHEANSNDTSLYGAWANRGLVIRSYSAKLGGVVDNTPYASVYGTNDNKPSANVELSVPDTLTQLLPGDYIETEIVYVVMPQFAADYYGPNANLASALTAMENTWEMIDREAVGNDLTVTASTGTVLSEYPIKIKALRNQAQFIVNGGIGYVPMTFTGLQHYRGFRLERNNSGTWTLIDQSTHGNDFWQTDYDSVSNTWEITYTVPLDSPGDVPQDVEFRLVGPDVNHASDPDPENNAEKVDSAKVLSWAPGSTATDSDIYLGTDYDSVMSATTASPEYMGNTTLTSYDPGGLSYLIDCFWRIDENDATDTYTGSVWSFATINAPESNPPTPDPATFAVAPAADSATQISMTAATGSDASGPVEYYFDETSGNAGGTDSGWQTLPTYIDTELLPETQYTYTVQMRDSASTPNVGTASAPVNVTTPVQEAVSGMVCWWKFDDDSATAADSSGTGNYGIVKKAEYVPGKIGTAAKFKSGATVEMQIADLSSVTDQITFACWIYGGDLQPQADHLLYALNSRGQVLKVHLPWSDGKVYWLAGNDISGGNTINKAAVDSEYKGQWNHWAFTKNATTGDQKMYLNGSLWHSGTGKTKTMDGINLLRLSASDYDGIVDDFRIYDFEMTEAEIAAVMAAGTNDMDADFDDSGLVDVLDLEYLAENWLKDGVALIGDLDLNGTVNICDFALFATQWLE